MKGILFAALMVGVHVPLAAMAQVTERGTSNEARLPGGAADYQKANFGIQYYLWHAVGFYDGSVYDIAKAIKGKQPWGAIPNFHWWTEPARGYYALRTSHAILRSHAEELRDAGIDFVVLDISNWDSRSKFDAKVAIEQPLESLLSIWSSVPRAPKIVPWAPLTSRGDMLAYVLGRLSAYPQLGFEYRGKPLALVVANPSYPIDPQKYAELKQHYTVRKMWGLFQSGDNWSFMEHCRTPNFLASRGMVPCRQRISHVEGIPEQIPVVPSYQLSYMSDKSSSVPKFHGRTFVQQFTTAFHNPHVPIVLITGWNEWIAQRYCRPTVRDPHKTSCTVANDHWSDGNKVFVDSYDAEYSRDIEPSKQPPGDFYFRLMRTCIAKYRLGQLCSTKDVPFPGLP
jgi:hypothetical protein